LQCIEIKFFHLEKCQSNRDQSLEIIIPHHSAVMSPGDVSYSVAVFVILESGKTEQQKLAASLASLSNHRCETIFCVLHSAYAWTNCLNPPYAIRLQPNS